MSVDRLQPTHVLADFAEQSRNSNKPEAVCGVTHSARCNRRVTSASRKCGNSSPLDAHSSNFSSSSDSENATDDSLSAAALLPNYRVHVPTLTRAVLEPRYFASDKFVRKNEPCGLCPGKNHNNECR